MTLLIIGLVLWSSIHLIPSAAPGVKGAWIKKLGESGYAISFAVLIACSLVLIVMGWRSSEPNAVFDPIEAIKPLTSLLMVVAITLFVAANHATRIRRVIRHPQLTGVVIWSLAHLLQNGNTRDLLLFCWLGVWAILAMFFINRRDGEWVKGASPSVAVEARFIAISLAVYVVVAFAHPFLSGKGII